MNGSIPKTLFTWSGRRLMCLVLTGFLISLFSVFPALGQDKNPIPSQSRTLLPPEEQIQLAEGAAPTEISKQATIYALRSKGYVKERIGNNGFSCLVEHQFLETIEPICYDAEGSATTLQARFFREELRANGLTEDEIAKQIDAGYKSGRFKAPAKSGFAYMLSIEAKVFDPDSKKVIIPPPHLMFYAPYLTSKDLGGQIGAHMPLLLWGGRPDTFIIVVPAFMCAGDGAKIWQCPRP
ncbi:MAG TPA: hypothetical protein VI584_09100 [Nitrospiria bacterium]|nr:hypothetical protein [Nitrospiria bacterium]